MFPWTVFNSVRDINMCSIILRFALSIAFGGAIGIERGKKRHAAGMRTHIVICIGAASTMMTSQYISAVLGIVTDPARLGAQVINGIGFIGVGTIVVTGHKQVKGLTTAGGLWASACMGLAIGIGFYEGAIIMCAALYIVLEVLNLWDTKFFKNSNNLQIYVEYTSETRFSLVLKELRKRGWHAVSVETVNAGGHDCTSMLLALTHSGKKVDYLPMLESLREVEGMLFVEKM